MSSAASRRPLQQRADGGVGAPLPRAGLDVAVGHDEPARDRPQRLDGRLAVLDGLQVVRPVDGRGHAGVEGLDGRQPVAGGDVLGAELLAVLEVVPDEVLGERPVGAVAAHRGLPHVPVGVDHARASRCRRTRRSPACPRGRRGSGRRRRSVSSTTRTSASVSTVDASSMVSTVPPRNTTGSAGLRSLSGWGHRLLLGRRRHEIGPLSARAARAPVASPSWQVSTLSRGRSVVRATVAVGDGLTRRRRAAQTPDGRASADRDDERCAPPDDVRRDRLPSPAGPLAGLLVADFSRILAGPYSTMLLADLGAEVVKVEGPGGDDTRTWQPPVRDGVATYYLGVNRNKRSVALDLKDPDDLALATELARRADVFVENFKPGGLARFGLDYDAVAADQPGHRLRLDQRLRQRPRRRAAAGLRPDRAGHLGVHEPDRRGRRRAVPRRRRAVRRHGRAARDDRRPRGAQPPARDRRGPARRGQPAVVGAVGAGEPDQRVRRRRRRPVPHGQQPPEPVPVRAAAVLRRRADHHRRERRPVPPAVRGARRARSWSTTRGSGATRTGRPTATSCGRCWWSGCAPAPRWSGSARSSGPASRAGRSTPSTRASASPRRSAWTRSSSWGRVRPRSRRCATRSPSPTTPPGYRLPPPTLDEHGDEIRRWLAEPAGEERSA